MDEKQAVEHINEFFASLTEDFIEVQDKWLDGGSSEPLPVISEESLEKKLKGLSVRKASGPYDPNIRDLKHVRRQRDDDSQNKLLQINYCEEELLCIIHCMYIRIEFSLKRLKQRLCG